MGTDHHRQPVLQHPEVIMSTKEAASAASAEGDQKSSVDTEMLRRTPEFQKLVRELVQDFMKDQRFQTSDMSLEEACDAYIAERLEDTNICAIHAGRRSSSKKPYKCNVCRRRYRGEHGLKIHMSVKHKSPLNEVSG